MKHQQRLGNFIDKLQYLLNRPEYAQIICWDKTQTMIDIISQQQMETQIIPLYFRHQKYQSFVRQLNLYGFKKIKCNGKHRFTHSQLLNGEKLQSIKTHKSNKTNKKIQKGLSHKELLQKQMVLQGISNNEDSNSNSKQQINNQSIKPILKYQNQSSNRDVATNNQPQLYAGFANPYFNYWNMFSLAPMNQLSNYMCINSMQVFH